MKYLQIKNWEKFQHYNKRTPPWIKLHRDLLRDYDFIQLPDDAKLQLMLIWLLASQTENKIPADPNFIKLQIGVTGELKLNLLIDKGYLVHASNMLATCKQSAIAETETETETETEVYMLELKKKFPTIDIDLQKEKFENYIQSKGKKYKNKKAAFRNWCINAVEYQKEKQPTILTVKPKKAIHELTAEERAHYGY